MTLFPNPASEEVTMVIYGEYQSGRVKIFDWTGRSFFHRNLEQAAGQLRFAVDEWQAGIYLVQLQLDGAFLTGKLIVE